MLPRITVAICEPMAGVGGKRRLLSGGTGFLAISGIVYILFYFFWVWLRIFHGCNCFCLGLREKFFTRRQDEFPSWYWCVFDFRMWTPDLFVVLKVWFAEFDFRFGDLMSFPVFMCDSGLGFRVWQELIMMSRYINPALWCLAMPRAGGTLVWSYMMSRGNVDCTQEYDGDDPFYIWEFHISMRHYM